MLLVSIAGGAWMPLANATERARELSLAAVQSEPSHRARLTSEELLRLKTAVTDNPRLRQPRFDWVRALIGQGDLVSAARAAESWREHDAYNLVAVRLLGDIQSELGDSAAARRTYSAIVELLPKDVEARRALATVLKQSGDLKAARTQLKAALELGSREPRTAFELGDVEQRLGATEEAKALFESISRAPDADESLRYPARQRLAQLYAAERRVALNSGEATRAEEIGRAIEGLALEGGLENDIKIYLSWDTDRTDVDLWVTTPSGERVSYEHPRGKGGEALYHDVTTGYGPESFTVHRAALGEYTIQVNFFGAGGAFKEARGEVVVVLDEGRPRESRYVLPYRLFQQKDTVTVAKVLSGEQVQS